MMLNGRIRYLSSLHRVSRKAEEYLSTLPPDTPYDDLEHKFQEIGLERGWGNYAERATDMISMLLELLEAPDSSTLEKFLGRIPMVFNVVILSPHGYFAQENVLGYPDTGGQVVYILGQVPVLEREMLKRIQEQGLDITPRILIVTRLLPDAVGTTCGQRLEKVFGAEHSHILRVPFRTEKGIVRNWISRFEDLAKEITAELQEKPDLITGNYSEGNLAASLLAHKFGVTHCTIAHALEKTKYPDSDIYLKAFLTYVLVSPQLVLLFVSEILKWSLFSLHGGSVFHVTDQLGNKITDESLIHYIQEEICANRMASKDVHL